jgi:hypothetical protein
MRNAFVWFCYVFAVFCVLLAIAMPFIGGKWYHVVQACLSAGTCFVSGKLVASLPESRP